MKATGQVKIYCTNPEPGQLNFYAEAVGNTYCLFSQPYRSGVERVFSKGIYLTELNNTKFHKYDACVSKTVEKLPAYLRYINKEYDLGLFRNSRKKADKKRKPRFLAMKEESFFTEMKLFSEQKVEQEKEIA